MSTSDNNVRSNTNVTTTPALANKNKEDYFENLCETFQKEIEIRKSIQDEGTKPVGSNCLNVVHASLNVAENSKNHLTNKYEQCCTEPMKLIARRGFPFVISLHCDRPYDVQNDVILVELNYGANPNFQQGTKKIIKVEQTSTSGASTWRWNAQLKEAAGCDIDIQINTNTNCPVGEWKMKIQTGTNEFGTRLNAYTSFVCPDFIFIIFNPWCKDDTVYMDDAKLLNEYVLNDTGAVWQGAKRGQFQPCHWNFGQFEDASLYAALTILRISDLTDLERKDPVLTTRKLTEAVNRFVVAGRWQDPYDDGTPPWEWTGSIEIMEQFMKNPKERVKYGQCWVFSAVLVTLCRSLGIPCRSVTNLSSAHDTDRSLTIDDVFIKKQHNNTFKKYSKDSVWNFHVWNEAYMKRNDLPPGYDGWQVCDSTPQEKSEGKYQCGPMSVEALRSGKVEYDYDGWFIYGEVNADVVSWYYVADLNSPNGMKLLKVDTDTKQVGVCIVTTDLANPNRTMELTNTYKPKEGTDEERQQFRSAVRAVVANDRTEILKLYNCDQKTKEDITFQMNDIDIVPFGKKVSSFLAVTNESLFTRTIVITMEMFIVRYDGVRQTTVAEYAEKLTLEENKIAKIKLDSQVNVYGKLLQEHSHMCVEVIAHVEETAQIFSNRDTFMIQKPTLEITGDRKGRVNQPMNVSILMNNPCNFPLNNCQIKIEGSGLGRIFKTDVAKQMKAREELKVLYTVIPRRVGKKSVVAIFTSDELTNIRGTYSVEVD